MATSAQKVALVTGASGGIGSTVARRPARDGFAVVANYSGSPGIAERKASGSTARAARERRLRVTSGAVGDRVPAAMLRRIRLADLLAPAPREAESAA